MHGERVLPDVHEAIKLVKIPIGIGALAGGPLDGRSDPPTSSAPPPLLVSINRSDRRSFLDALRMFICSSITVSRFLSKKPWDWYSTMSEMPIKQKRVDTLMHRRL